MRLRDRLKASNMVPGPGPGPAPSADASGWSASGWEQTRWAAPVGTPLAAALGPHAVPRGMESLAVPEARQVAAAVQALEGPEASAVEPTRPVVVLDIETSGLGASLVPFMAALAWHEGGQVHLMQWTLHEPTAERAFLADVFAGLDRVLMPRTRLLSYNGKSFDLPRLRVRAQRLALGGLCGDAVGALSAAHLDLVIPSRRVFKRDLPNCRLGTLEAEILGHRRQGDMGGMEIAELWERMAATPGLAGALAQPQEHADDDMLDPFLRDDLAAAQLHNRGDVFGLCSVAVAVGQRLEQPRSIAEAIGAATHLRQVEAPQRASTVLRAYVEGPQHRKQARPLWIEAALLLAELHRSAAAHEPAAELWRQVCDASPGHVRAHEALAKHLEHRSKRPDLALDVAKGSLAPCPRRLARLEKKLSALQARDEA